MREARIGGVVFSFSGGDGFVVGPDGWSGWDGGVSIRRDETPRPNGHGVFDAPGYLGGRLVAISGHILGKTPADTVNLAARLTGLLADGSKARLVVDTGSEVTWADVRLADQTQVTVWGSDPRVADFMVQLFAPDPYRYGEVRSFPAGAAFHRGNTGAWPVIEVEGPSSGWTVTYGGNTVTVTQSLTSGQTHRYDTRTGRLTRNGALQAGAVSVAAFGAHPPGKALTYTRTAGTGTVTVHLTDTFA